MHAETDPIRTALTDEEARVEARRIIAEFATSYRDPSPLPPIGSAPPVPQPGRPPMSSKATDDCVRMLAFGGTTLMVSAGAGLVMVTSEFADPTVIGMICAAPAAIAVPILALARLVRRAGEAVPAEHHHHYTGPVHQQTVNSHTRLWGKTTNNL